ncbi:unnamed protein product, partial [Ectocarpus sp. 12 AP-2014]
RESPRAASPGPRRCRGTPLERCRPRSPSPDPCTPGTHQATSRACSASACRRSRSRAPGRPPSPRGSQDARPCPADHRSSSPRKLRRARRTTGSLKRGLEWQERGAGATFAS